MDLTSRLHPVLPAAQASAKEVDASGDYPVATVTAKAEDRDGALHAEHRAHAVATAQWFRCA